MQEGGGAAGYSGQTPEGEGRGGRFVLDILTRVCVSIRSYVIHDMCGCIRLLGSARREISEWLTTFTSEGLLETRRGLSG